MKTYTLTMTLQSDTTFGRGDGVPGLVDAEVEHDRYGLPYLRGRALKGLLAEECANLLFALNVQGGGRWHDAAQRLFGRPGSTLEDNAIMRVGDARLPADLRAAIAVDMARPPKAKDVDTDQHSADDKRDPNRYTAADVLESLMAIRRQTAMDETGVPEEGSLRAMRVILRETTFEAALLFTESPTDDDLALLAACTLALHRVGTGRNRGRGRVKVRLCNVQGQNVTQTHYAHFAREVLG